MESLREAATGISTGLGSWLEGHRAEIRLALRTTVAGLVTFALAHWLELAQGYWAVLTAVIVIQGNVGGSLKAAADRLIGTFGGGACGVLVALILPQTDMLSRGVGLGLALAPLAFAAALLPSLRIAPLTAVIVLLGSYGQAGGLLPSAVARLVEIGLGSAIACAVSLFVLPTRAHRQVSEGAGRILASLAELTPALLAGLSNARDRAKLHLLNRQIRTALVKLDAAADEARRERASHLTEEPDPEPLVRTLRRLRYDFVMVDRATRDPLPTAVAALLSPPLAELSAALEAFLRESASAITARRPPPPLDPLRRALAAYGAAMAEVRRQGLTRDLPGEAVARIFGLAFAFEQIARELADLADRARELADVST